MSIGLHLAANSVWDMYNTIQNEIEQGVYENLPELHALSCAIKVLVTSESAAAADQLRRACGGHGFMSSSNLPGIFGLITAACTYEGENTVLLLQIARYLVKVSFLQIFFSKSKIGKFLDIQGFHFYFFISLFMPLIFSATFQVAGKAADGTPLPSSVAYLNNTFGHKQSVDIYSDFGLTELFEKVAYGVVNRAVATLNREKDWNACSILLVEAATAHGRSFVISEFSQGVANSPVSLKLKKILSNLFQLFAISWILEAPANFLRFANIEFSHIDQLVQRRDSLLTNIRPLPVPRVDSFDFRDEVLRSTLGSWDGWVYHRLFQAAAGSPLNKMGGVQGGIKEQIRKGTISKL